MPIKDEDLEVIEETINNFEYFYEEESAVKANKKIVLKYRLISIAIITFVTFFLLTVLGISRMKVYGTNDILTHDEMRYIEVSKACDEIMEDAQKFYAYNTSQNAIDSTCVYVEIVDSLFGTDGKKLGAEAFINKPFSGKTMVDWAETFTGYLEDLESISNNLPKKKDFSGYVNALTFYVQGELSILEFINDNYDGIIGGNISLNGNEITLNIRYTDLASQYILLND